MKKGGRDRDTGGNEKVKRRNGNDYGDDERNEGMEGGAR